MEDTKLFVKTDEEAATDLTALLMEIFNRNQSLQKSPLYIVAESYGGKYAATLGLSALKAIESGNLKLKLGGELYYKHSYPMEKHKRSCIDLHQKFHMACLHCVGVALGDSWISPEDFVASILLNLLLPHLLL